MNDILSETELAEFICTRISHDVIGNVGAVSNAVEIGRASCRERV